MDEINQSLVTLLAQNARTPVATLARKLNVARTTIQARLERLERNGTITGYTVKLNDTVRQNHIRATVLLQIEPRAAPAVTQRLKTYPQVEVAHSTSGRFDMILRVVCPSTKNLDEILDTIGAIKGVVRSESLIQLATKIDRAI